LADIRGGRCRAGPPDTQTLGVQPPFKIGQGAARVAEDDIGIHQLQNVVVLLIFTQTGAGFFTEK